MAVRRMTHLNKSFAKNIVSVLVTPLMLGLWLLRRVFVIRVMSTHHQLFGHLSLEPEKYLSARDSQLDLYEIDFVGEKDWKNIRVHDSIKLEKRILDIWTFGRKRNQANRYLVKLWKRQVVWLPSFIIDVLLRSNRIFGERVLSEYRFSTLVSVDRYLDSSGSHIRFRDNEIAQASSMVESLGFSPGSPYVCLICRNQKDSDQGLRNRNIRDFEYSILELVARGIGVIRMGSINDVPLAIEHPLVCDYANSGKRTELLDLYLLANCKFAISTLSGPDATCLAFRRPVLYVDIANYSLCFTGTALTTWVPGVIVDTNTNKKLSLREVFDSGAGWFWRDSQFHERGLDVVRSSPEEIRDYTIDMLNWVDSGESTVDKERQNIYRSTMADAMGDLGEKWHGQINSRMSIPFLTKHGDWFLS